MITGFSVIFVYMKELLFTPPTDDSQYDYYNELTEYVSIFTEKHFPLHQNNYMSHIYSAAYENFNRRYIDNKIDTSFIDEFEDDEDLQEMITALGYDFDKFWYLLLYINDYSYCACKREIEFFKDKYEYLEDLYRYIGEGAELTLRVKGKKKVEITEKRTLELIRNIIKVHIDITGERTSISLSPVHNDITIRKENSNSYHIWFFATMFMMFFDIVPPNNIRKKKDGYTSYSKKLLISKLIYLVELSSNESFLESEYTLSGFLNQYKDSTIFDKFVIEYM
jgi:hypothetical protein